MELIVDIEKQLRNFPLRAKFTMRDEVFALLGASGCGKSMTLKCIAGLMKPDRGHIELDGQVLYDSEQGIDLPPQQRHIGYLFQSYALFPNMTIHDNIAFVAEGSAEEKERKVQEGLHRFHLEELSGAYPAELSGGQQQRAALARILAADAHLLLLDEPFSALDNYLKWQLELEMLEVFQSYHGAALLVSHDRGEVYRLADRIAVINRGQMEHPCSREEIFEAPGTLAATLLTGCKNVSAARPGTAGAESPAGENTEGADLYAGDWQLPLHAGEVPENVHYIGLRAHFILYCAPGDRSQVEAAKAHPDSVLANVHRFAVTRVIEDVFSSLVMVRRADAPDARSLRWELPKEDWHHIASTLPPDQTLWLYFPPDKLMLMEQ